MKVQQALEQIKQYIDLGEWEHYVQLVLNGLYLDGKLDEILDEIMRDKKYEMLTEEQLIEREKVSGFGVKKGSTIL